MNDISQRLLSYMNRKIPMMGEFILKKQCRDLGIDYEEIPINRMGELAERLAKAAEMFLGYDGSRDLKTEIVNKKFLR